MPVSPKDPTVTEDMIDRTAPDEVIRIITSEARQPAFDPTLGIEVRAAEGPAPHHRLVAIGDSLTQGFQSAAIYNTDILYPAIVAYEMGCLDTFRFPTFRGFGGLPLNIEYLIRDLEHRFGDRIDNPIEFALAGFEVDHFMAQVEDWWERGPGSTVPQRADINHDLAIYGWDLRDTLERTYAIADAGIQKPTPSHLFQLVENANERVTRRVLPHNQPDRPDGASLTPLGAARALGDEGGAGIETLVVMLGANNVLGSVMGLSVQWSKDEGFQDLKAKENYNVWLPRHFQVEWDLLVEQLKQINARHVVVATVPHVTIIPLAHGVGDNSSRRRPGRKASRYFPYYTYPWIPDADFEPTRDPNITANQARAVDSAIDQYNYTITASVKAARAEGRDWLLFDLAGLLDRLAARRYINMPEARPDWWQPYDLPPELDNLRPKPDSQFFTSGPEGRTKGGLFSLDGVHPTTIAYGVVAQEVISILQKASAPVRFFRNDGVTERTGPVRVDFTRLLRLDTLLSDPPRSISSDLKLLGWIDGKFHITGRMLRKES